MPNGNTSIKKKNNNKKTTTLLCIAKTVVILEVVIEKDIFRSATMEPLSPRRLYRQFCCAKLASLQQAMAMIMQQVLQDVLLHHITL